LSKDKEEDLFGVCLATALLLLEEFEINLKLFKCQQVCGI
jgi:hypothetical protein